MTTQGQIDGINAGYWFTDSGIGVDEIDSTLFTHLFCAFANLDPNTGFLTVPAECTTFSSTVRQRNPSVKTLLSIGGGSIRSSDFNKMAAQSDTRHNFIKSSISLARSYDFDGVDLDWEQMTTRDEMTNLATLLNEWQDALNSETSGKCKARLLLTAAVHVNPVVNGRAYPATVMAETMNWINVMAYDYYAPAWSPSKKGGHAVLHDPTEGVSGSRGITAWVNAGVPLKKLVLGMPYYGYAWKLVDPNMNGLEAPASGADNSVGGGVPTYRQIREFINQRGAQVVYDFNYVTNYCYLGTTWISYDDTDSISAKVSYAKTNGLLGYFAWHVAADNNWALSQLAKHTWAATPRGAQHQ